MSDELDRRVAEIPGCFSETIGEENKLVSVDISEIYGAELLYERKGRITIVFYQYGKPIHDHKPRYEIVLRRKHLPGWMLSKARPYKGGLMREVTPDTWIDTIMDTIDDFKAHEKEIVRMCEAFA